jgi:hypothetical protein
MNLADAHKIADRAIQVGRLIPAQHKESVDRDSTLSVEQSGRDHHAVLRMFMHVHLCLVCELGWFRLAALVDLIVTTPSSSSCLTWPVGTC